MNKAINDFNGGRILMGITRLPFKCPVAPYETALLLDSYLRRKGIRDKVSMTFFTQSLTTYLRQDQSMAVCSPAC